MANTGYCRHISNRYVRLLQPISTWNDPLTQSSSYTEAKSQLLAAKSLGLKDDVKTHVLASFIAGTVATTVCAPADVLKSRFQNLSKAQGPQPSVVKYVIEIVGKEGPLVLMKGWTPAWMRLA